MYPNCHAASTYACVQRQQRPLQGDIFAINIENIIESDLEYDTNKIYFLIKNSKESNHMKYFLLINILINSLTIAAFSQIKDPFFKENQNIIQKKQVTVGILVVDVQKIDDAEQSITLDFAIRLMWKDESLAGKHENMKLYGYHEIWTPDLQLANELDLKRKRKENLEVYPDGMVILRQRFQGDLSLIVDFSDFPIDKQTINIQLVAPMMKDIEFVPNDTFTGQIENFSIQEWEIGQGSLVIEPFKALSYEFVACNYKIEAQRRAGYYFWKVIIPLTIVIFMSWTVFWIDPVHIEAQLAVAATAMLTIIAYQFALSNMLPRISYFTRLDYFIVGSNIMVFLALLEAVFSSNFAKINHEKIARKLDLWSKYIFPVFYVIILVITFVV